jgi:hypothetical protein
MWEYNPDLKLIVILRNPITRAYSHWNMQRSRNVEPLPFWEAIQKERDRCREALPYQHRLYSYVDRGFYSEQLRRLWTYFPKEQVLVLRTEDLRNSPLEFLEEVCGFLGIDPPLASPRGTCTPGLMCPAWWTGRGNTCTAYTSMRSGAWRGFWGGIAVNG